MHLMETLFEKIALALHNTTLLAIYDPETGKTTEVDMKTPWIRMTMKESIQKYAHIDVDQYSDETLRALLSKDANMKMEELKKATRGLLVAHVFESFVEDKLIQPHHIIDHPIETTPLCKPHRDENKKREGLIERFETFILGREMSNAYSELNDPELQRVLLEDQAARLAAGDLEANPLDEDFIEALCQGMPPAGGIGIGIDRMVMLFTNSHSIRDVIGFPLMRTIEK
jgi:lysyl-tRNA synthetase class 2